MTGTGVDPTYLVLSRHPVKTQSPADHVAAILGAYLGETDPDAARRLVDLCDWYAATWSSAETVEAAAAAFRQERQTAEGQRRTLQAAITVLRGAQRHAVRGPGESAEYLSEREVQQATTTIEKAMAWLDAEYLTFPPRRPGKNPPDPRNDLIRDLAEELAALGPWPSTRKRAGAVLEILSVCGIESMPVAEADYERRLRAVARLLK